jgi:hypothetical protein
MSVRSEIIRLLDTVSILGGRNYADTRPEGEPLPHTVMLDGISQAPALIGDNRTMAWRRIGQVDLWEDAAAASQSTQDAVVNALDGAAVAGSFRLRVASADRVYDPNTRWAHTAITLEAVRLRSG